MLKAEAAKANTLGIDPLVHLSHDPESSQGGQGVQRSGPRLLEATLWSFRTRELFLETLDHTLTDKQNIVSLSAFFSRDMRSPEGSETLPSWSNSIPMALNG